MFSRLLCCPRFLSRPFLGVAAVLCFAALLPTAHAATTIYAKFGPGTGAYAGEVTTPAAYAGWAMISSTSLGFSNPITIGQSQPTRATTSDVALSRSVDRLTPQLLQILLTGAVIGTKGGVNLTLDYVQGNATTPYLRLEFKQAYVSSQSSNASTGGDSVFEAISVTYDAIQMTYYPATGNPIVYSWTFSANQTGF